MILLAAFWLYFFQMIPPPPPMSVDMVDDEALGSMLISWYMSGYHTGFYLVCTQKIFDLVKYLHYIRIIFYFVLHRVWKKAARQLPTGQNRNTNERKWNAHTFWLLRTLPEVVATFPNVPTFLSCYENVNELYMWGECSLFCISCK